MTTPTGGNFAPLQKDPPEVPPRTRSELQGQATPGTYFAPSPEAPEVSARDALAQCGSNAWFSKVQVLLAPISVSLLIWSWIPLSNTGSPTAL
eukprot:5357165-Alexandrium_andersonii.AAC.1